MNNFSPSSTDFRLSKVAYLVVVHGSRNSSYRQQLDELQDLIVEGLMQSCLLATAYLELGEKPLSISIIDFAIECAKNGYQKLKILPLFLFSGTHVLQDIPKEVNIAQQNSPVFLELMFPIGQSRDLIDLLKSKYQKYPQYDRILFCHGTSLEQGKEESKILGKKLNAQVAYWSISPHLSTIIQNMINSGSKNIVILPYFLFSGKIIDSIEQDIKLLQEKTNINLVLLSPLGATIELAQVIIQKIKENPYF
ncbi:sirohydrochlorin chelatase [Geminocystis sp. NIES-3709]|uniref:sirohydrochlorin chelatase n=1 Tax=Geminocystis sp. NIES-3709 TaxID=1617448 RepID=UPI0005FCA8F4|nr:sirohydrochlorin chelatase [Geminocystis sp. NIES-3709]BAQ64270.1 sirohydrochlorin cobaltochelatase [Geminocystis sp. NIES-3709]